MRATPAAAQLVARALAAGMRYPAIRAHVRDALRSSRVNEHKVVLQDLITTPGGQRMLEAAAARVGVTPSDLPDGFTTGGRHAGSLRQPRRGRRV